jgi:hypothetical protein
MSDDGKWWSDYKVITRIMLGVIGTLLLLGLVDTQGNIKSKVDEKTFYAEIKAIHEKIDTNTRATNEKLDLLIRMIDKHERETQSKRY